MNCDGCGACCTEMGTPPFLKHEIYNLPEDLQDEVLKFYNKPEGFKREEDRVPCYWYDPITKKCKHYDDRPWVCKNFDVGSKSCLLWRSTLVINETK